MRLPNDFDMKLTCARAVLSTAAALGDGTDVGALELIEVRRQLKEAVCLIAQVDSLVIEYAVQRAEHLLHGRRIGGDA